MEIYNLFSPISDTPVWVVHNLINNIYAIVGIFRILDKTLFNKLTA